MKQEEKEKILKIIEKADELKCKIIEIDVENVEKLKEKIDFLDSSIEKFENEVFEKNFKNFAEELDKIKQYAQYEKTEDIEKISNFFNLFCEIDYQIYEINKSCKLSDLDARIRRLQNFIDEFIKNNFIDYAEDLKTMKKYLEIEMEIMF